MIARRRRLLEVRTLHHERARAEEAKARMAVELAHQAELRARHEIEAVAGTTVTVQVLQNTAERLAVAQHQTRQREEAHHLATADTIRSGRAWLRAQRSLEKAQDELREQERKAEQRELDEHASGRHR